MADIASIIWAVAALVGSISVAIYLWRNPKASASFKHKDSVLAVNASHERLPQVDLTLTGLATEQPEQLPGGNQAQLVGTEVEEETRFAQAYRLLTAGDYEAGQQVLEEAAKDEDGRDKRVSLLAFGQHLAAGRGSGKALADLRSTVSSNPDVFEAHIWLGAGLKKLGRTDEAIAVFDGAFASATTDEDRATAVVWSVTSLLEKHEPREVVRRMLDRTKGLDEQTARARILSRIGKLYLDLTPPDLEHAFSIYEAALSLDPTDSSLRFDVAHAYGEHGGEAEAFFHYSRLFELDSSHAGAANNIGVAASNLSMETVAVTYYRKAEALGNTLATSNLAWKLINVGFLQEARTMLDMAVTKPDADRNLLSALGGIAKAEVSDEEKQTALQKRVAWYRELAAYVGIALAENTAANPGVAGRYAEGYTKIDVSCPSGDSVVGTIKSILETLEFSGKLIGSAMIISWSTSSRKAANTTLLTSWSSDKTGHGILALRGNQLHGYTYEGERAVDPTQAKGYAEWRFERE